MTIRIFIVLVARIVNFVLEPMPMADKYLKHRFHGRRKGKALTDYRQGLLDGELGRYKINYIPREGGDLSRSTAQTPAFAGETDRPTWLEIGFGNGEFISHMAQSCPDINFIGCEPFINGVDALLASIETPVENLKIWNLYLQA